MFGFGGKSQAVVRPTWRQSPRGDSQIQDPQRSEIEAESRNPFAPNMVYPDLYSGYEEYAADGVLVDGFCINPRDYGVENFANYTGVPDLDNHSRQGRTAPSADERVIEYGSQLSDKDRELLSRAVHLLKSVHELLALEKETKIAPSEQEKRAIETARQQAADILTKIFEPLIDEQEQRALIIAEARREREEKQANHMRTVMARRSVILSQLENDLGTDTEALGSLE